MNRIYEYLHAFYFRVTLIYNETQVIVNYIYIHFIS